MASLEGSRCWGPEAAYSTPQGLFFLPCVLHALSLCLDYGSLVMEKYKNVYTKEWTPTGLKWTGKSGLGLRFRSFPLAWVNEGKAAEGQGDQLGAGYSRKAVAAES